MSEPFDPATGSVRVRVTLVGPRRSQEVWCTVDTGSTRTVLPAAFLRHVGYDLSAPTEWTRIRSATGFARVPAVRVPALTALDRVRTDLLVAAHEVPLGTTANGLLGLGFFRGFILELDFIRGRISLSSERWWQFWR